jgi:hypothetical protein
MACTKGLIVIQLLQQYLYCKNTAILWSPGTSDQPLLLLLVLLVLFVYVLQDNIAVLSEAGSSSADKAQALANLQVLVEPIDNANGEQGAAAAEGQPASLQPPVAASSNQ